MVGTEPTGNVTATDTASAPVNIFGGANVTVAGTNGTITVGAGNKATNPTGNVTATESACSPARGRTGLH